jgi:hypothetical protein
MPSRENRLLLLVVLVSGAALLLLARFRFPGDERPLNPAPTPLERLAAQATYDDLASIVAQCQTRVSPALLVLRVVAGAAPPLGPPASPTPRPAPSADGGRPRARLVLAVRVRTDLAFAQLMPGDRVESVIGSPGVASLVAADPVRLVGLVRVPAADDTAPWIWQPSPASTNPRYVAVAEATQGGPALRPLFLGRTDPFSDPRWERPLLALGGAGVTTPGSLIFSLDGNLEGLTVLEDNLPVIAPARALLAAITDLERGRTTGGGDLGIELADLAPAMAAATGTDHGAVIVYVRPDGPAADVLRVGDVIAAIDDAEMASAALASLRIARVAGRPAPAARGAPAQRARGRRQGRCSAARGGP